MQPGVPQLAFRTDSQMIVTETPSEDNNVLRLVDLYAALRVVEVSDIDNPTELTSIVGGHPGSMILIYESGDPSDFTIYAWDEDVTSDDSPLVVKSSDGAWIAIAGKNNYYSTYFWQDGTTIGVKLKRDSIWVYFKPNSTYNGLSVDHIEAA